MDKKSPDAFRTISEVAEWLGVPTHVLRFWESRFTQVKPVKRAGGRRYYRPADMELLGGIRKLLHEDGVTIRGVQKLLREHGVKHVASMSPPIDSDELRNDDHSNVVSLEAVREETPEVSDVTSDVSTPPAPTPDAVEAPIVAQSESGDAVTDDHTAPVPAVDPAPQTPADIAAQTGEDIPAAPAFEAPPAEMTQEVASGAQDPQMTDPLTPTDETYASAPPEPAQDPVEIDPSHTAIDPLEPVPHDGPTIAETLAANGTLAEPELSSDTDTHLAEELPAITPDDVLVTAEPDPFPGDVIETHADAPSDTPASMDLFSFADTVSADTESKATIEAPKANAPAVDLTEQPPAGAFEAPELDAPFNEDAPADAFESQITSHQSAPPEDDVAMASDPVPVEPTEDVPAAVSLPPSLDTHPESATLIDASPQAPDEPQGESVAEIGDASSAHIPAFQSDIADSVEIPQMSEELTGPQEIQTDSTPLPAETDAATGPLVESIETESLHQPDISHIPADPVPDQMEDRPNTPTISLRSARQNGTNAHMPVLQALADRLEALSVQMNRSDMS